MNTTCDPTSPRADAYGCGPKRCELDEYVCDDGWVCDPDSQTANQFGCGYAPVASGGAPNATPTTGANTAGAGATGGPNAMGGAGNSPEPDGAASTPIENTEPGPVISEPQPSTPSSESNGDGGPLPEVRPDGSEAGSACRADVDCRVGYCVNGRCEEALGSCR